MKKLLIILAIALVGCGESSYADGKLNALTTPVVVMSKGEGRSVMFVDGDNQIKIIISASFSTLQVGDTVRK